MAVTPELVVLVAQLAVVTHQREPLAKLVSCLEPRVTAATAATRAQVIHLLLPVEQAVTAAAVVTAVTQV